MKNIELHNRFINAKYLSSTESSKRLLDQYIVVIQNYLEFVKDYNNQEHSNYKLKSLAIIHNYNFSLMFELITSLKYGNYQSCFRVSRGILENKIIGEFINENSDVQGYWYVNWHFVKQVNKLNKQELSDVYQDLNEYENAINIYNSFCKQHQRVYSNDYGFAQVSIGNQYITLKDIALSTNFKDQDYEYYKFFSDLSHSSNTTTSKVDYYTKSNTQNFTKNIEIMFYSFLLNTLVTLINITDKTLISSFIYENMVIELSLLRVIINDIVDVE